MAIMPVLSVLSGLITRPKNWRLELAVINFIHISLRLCVTHHENLCEGSTRRTIVNTEELKEALLINVL